MLKKMKNIRCVGDSLHNQCIDVLFDGVPLNEPRVKGVIKILDDLQKKYPNKEWIFDLLSGKTECKKLNALMKSKTDATFQKRTKAYILYLEGGTHYGRLMRSFEIQEFKKLIG